MTPGSASHPVSTATSAGGLFTGPAGAELTAQITMPVGLLVGGAIAGAMLVGILVIGVSAAISGTGAVLSGVLGTAIGAGASVGATMLTRPWRARGFAQWPFVMLAAQAGSCLGVIGAVVLLYFSALHGTLDALVLTIASGASFVGSWAGMVRVIGARISAVTGQDGSPGEDDQSGPP